MLLKSCSCFMLVLVVRSLDEDATRAWAKWYGGRDGDIFNSELTVFVFSGYVHHMSTRMSPANATPGPSRAFSAVFAR